MKSEFSVKNSPTKHRCERLYTQPPAVLFRLCQICYCFMLLSDVCIKRMVPSGFLILNLEDMYFFVSFLCLYYFISFIYSGLPRVELLLLFNLCKWVYYCDCSLYHMYLVLCMTAVSCESVGHLTIVETCQFAHKVVVLYGNKWSQTLSKLEQDLEGIDVEIRSCDPNVAYFLCKVSLMRWCSKM